MERGELKPVIEALIFVSEKPLPLERIKEAVGEVSPEEIAGAIAELKADYEKSGRSFDIVEIAGGYQFATNPEYAKWIGKLYKKPVERLSGPSMETLSIIAYKQPISRGEIEAIRGVSVDGVIKTLLERNLIKIKGRRESPGRPIVYGTTEEFLIRFGLKSLKDLPSLKEFSAGDLDFEKEKLNKKEQEIVREKEAIKEQDIVKESDKNADQVSQSPAEDRQD